jgi:predicted MarR family transcription regulator
MTAAGAKDMTITDVLVLHHINHRAREKKLADIASILNSEDTHVVNYALKTLQALGPVKTEGASRKSSIRPMRQARRCASAMKSASRC